jgi:hypothetical protein
MDLRSRSTRLAILAATAAALLAGCPLPFDYSGSAAGKSNAVDPSSPNLTAPVTVSYAAQGGASGTVADTGSVTLGNTTTVTLSTTTRNAVIYYTDDGSQLTNYQAAKAFSGSSGQLTMTRTASVQTLDIHAVAIGPDMLPSAQIHATLYVSPYPILSIACNAVSISETGGTATFTITSSVAPSSNITVNLQTSGTYLTSYVTGVPAPNTAFTATLTQSTTTVTVPITSAADHDNIDNAVTLTIQPDPASPQTYSVGAPASATVALLDNHYPTLTLAADRALMADGQTATFTVTSSFAPASNLVVNLSSTGYNPSYVNVPSTVTIPAGAASATFPVTAPSMVGYPLQTPLVSLAAGSYYLGTPSARSLVIADTTYAPVGAWNFSTGSLSSSVAGAPAWSVTGSVPFVNGSLSFPGVYGTGLPPSGDSVSTDVSSIINQNLFTIGLGFQLADLNNRCIVVGGSSYRWLVVWVDPSGNLYVDLNNHVQSYALFTAVTAGVPHTLLVSIDVATLTVVAYLDGVRSSVALPSGFTWNNGGSDLLFTTNDYSRGLAFSGLWNWFYLSNTALP